MQPTQHKTGHFKDVLLRQVPDAVLMKHNRSRHASINPQILQDAYYYTTTSIERAFFPGQPG